MPIPKNLKYFKESEFKYPELMKEWFVYWLDTVRDVANEKFILTSDGRPRNVNAGASGSSSTSLHLVGQAVDMKLPVRSRELWNIVSAVVLRSATSSELRKELERREVHGQLPVMGVELELVHGPTDRHIHLGVDSRVTFNELILADD